MQAEFERIQRPLTDEIGRRKIFPHQMIVAVVAHLIEIRFHQSQLGTVTHILFVRAQTGTCYQIDKTLDAIVTLQLYLGQNLTVVQIRRRPPRPGILEQEQQFVGRIEAFGITRHRHIPALEIERAADIVLIDLERYRFHDIVDHCRQ